METRQAANERSEVVVDTAAGAGGGHAGMPPVDLISVHASTEGESISPARDTESTDLVSTRDFDRIGPRSSARPSIGPVSPLSSRAGSIYVPQGRVTRARFEERLKAIRAARAIKTTAQVESDAPLATQGDKETAERLSGELTTSVDEEDSDYEDSQSPQKQAESSEFESGDDEPLSKIKNRGKPKSAKRTKREVGPRKPSKTPRKRQQHQGSGDEDVVAVPNKRPRVAQGSGISTSISDAELTPTQRTNRIPNDPDMEKNSSSSDSSESSSSAEDDDAPAYLFELDGPLPPQDGSFMNGFHVEFADWDEFTHAFFEFVKDRFMIFKKRTSTNMETRNRSILDKIPEIFGGAQEEEKEEQEEQDRKERAREASIPSFYGLHSYGERYSGSSTAIRWHASGGHNHPVSASHFCFYAENRLPKARDDDDVRRGRSHRFYRYFCKNWLQCEDEWLTFKRGNVAHLGNNTNNRIEAKFGASKRVLHANMDLEETIRAIRELQAVSEDEYVDELTKIGSRNSCTGDAELDQLINTVSDHAYDLVEAEYTAVKKGVVHYSVRECNGNAILRSTSDGEDEVDHTISLENYRCSCLFAQVRLLPCRHVFFYRTHKGFDDIVPFKSINPRWSMRHPGNNIREGDVGPGHFRVREAKPKQNKDLTEGERFCKIMSVMKEIAGQVALMTPSRFTKWLDAMKNIRDACGKGVIPMLDPVEGSDAESTASGADDAGQTERRVAATEPPNETEDPTATQFKIPRVIEMRGARNSKQQSERQAVMNRIKKEAAKYLFSESIPRTDYSLADVQAEFQNAHYTYRSAISIICGIPIERVSGVPGVQCRREEHVIQDTSAVRFVLEEHVVETLREDFNNTAFVDGREQIPHDYTDHLFVLGDRKGCITPEQLFVMALFHSAIDDVQAVVVAVQWIRRIEITHKTIPAPFNDVSDHVDQGFIDAAVEAVEMMPLDEVRTAIDLTEATKVLEVASTKWLSTTTVNAILSCIVSLHNDVGVVKADYFTVNAQDMRERLLSATGAFSDEHTRLVSIANLGGMNGKHWQAFYIDFEDGECVLYDPLPAGREARFKTLEATVRQLVTSRRQQPLTYQKHTEVFGKLDQDDGGSCGVYCAVFLEYMMKRILFKEAAVLPSRVYRVRYMVLLGMALRKLSESE